MNAQAVTSIGPISLRASLEGPELTIVVPTFNERANVSLLIKALDEALAGVRWEVIFVDDDSPDRTAAFVRAYGAQDARVRCIRRIGRRGLAGACIEGMLAAQAAYIAVMDADLQHDEGLMTQMLEVLRSEDADVVVGSRYAVGPGRDGFSAQRWFASRVARQLARIALGRDLSDPTSGLFMLKSNTIEKIAPKLSTQGFKILADILASDPQLRVRELPYRFRPRLHGESKLDLRTALDFAGLLLAKITHDLVSIRFLNFLVVGASGVLVHLIALKAALSIPKMEFSHAQILATWISMTSNFLLNNAFTYRDQRLSGIPAIRGLFGFYLICSIGFLSNIGIANWLYANRPVWWFAGLVGSLVGAVWNYVLSTNFVWRPQ